MSFKKVNCPCGRKWGGGLVVSLYEGDGSNSCEIMLQRGRYQGKKVMCRCGSCRALNHDGEVVAEEKFTNPCMVLVPSACDDFKEFMKGVIPGVMASKKAERMRLRNILISSIGLSLANKICAELWKRDGEVGK